MSDASAAGSATQAASRLVWEVEALRARVLALDVESLPVDEGTLTDAERLHRAVLELDETVCEARNALLGRAVELRWTYQRIADATGLSVGRVGQLAPARPRAASASTD